MPLTESDYSSHDSMRLYVIGWIVYLFMWSMIIGIAVWQISAQVDYNFSQVSTRSILLDQWVGRRCIVIVVLCNDVF